MASQLPFDPLVASASDLQKLLDAGKVTSEDLVNVYLDQIMKHNHFGMRLNAIIATVDRDLALEAARALDLERRSSGKRGPLHGIPIVLKDSISTPSVGLPTTCGSFALVGANATKDAVITERLLKAGALIIGKNNLSEWAAWKESMMTAGWSAVGGQTQSPYVRGGVAPNAVCLGHSTPAGSSSGSAASVAAGFAPISIATESDGSLICPSGRGAVYGLKLTIGSVPVDGCLANSKWIAGNGAMAKSTLDVSDAVSALLETDNLSPHLSGSWEGLKVGVVDFSVWKPTPAFVEEHDSYFKQQDELLEHALAKIAADGAKIVRDVNLITPAEIVIDTPYSDFGSISGYEARQGFSKFMAGFEGTKVKTVEDLIQFNLDNAAFELPPEHPGQQRIIASAKSLLTVEDFEKYSVQVRSTAAKAVEALLKTHDIDVVIGSSDARLAGVAAAAGFPIGNVPLGFADFNGRAIGLSVLAPTGQELTILKVMSAWERSLPDARMPPPLLVNWDRVAAKVGQERVICDITQNAGGRFTTATSERGETAAPEIVAPAETTSPERIISEGATCVSDLAENKSGREIAGWSGDGHKDGDLMMGWYCIHLERKYAEAIDSYFIALGETPDSIQAPAISIFAHLAQILGRERHASSELLSLVSKV
ncbi:hypothetical protein GQX73_g10447 [Xylaria multiplex]|uniref:Amidase domain-containing protein n=1 Tax=Xylaria multiplex TaxID=323545 RepID=A0A7C8MJT3_9PEZI|nr:hypothetical protein GQX73_g10447 [Xylaria multiplex]